MKKILLLWLFIAAHLNTQAQCIEFKNCLAVQSICDISTNDAQLWNEPYWWDELTQSDDLSDAPCDISLTAESLCPGVGLSAQYLLFLDLDNDGLPETVIKSWDLPAAGMVRYNNWDTPNYDGGELRVFDERPVPADQKYQFALQTESIGDSLVARLRWNTPLAPNTYVDVQLPYSTAHKIRWIIEDDLGATAVCEPALIIKDCRNPSVVCINGMSANLMPTQEIAIWVSDFIQFGEDNYTPTTLLQFGIRKTGTGNGFPVDANGNPINQVVYNCDELGTQLVDLWVKDQSGNSDYCQTYVIVQDNLDFCDGNGSGPLPPTIICLNGQSMAVPTGGTVQVNAGQLLQQVYDDNTPVNQIQLGLRKINTGTGFPVDINGDPIAWLTFDETELGTQVVELWARDDEGNASFCETYVLITESSSSSNAPTVVCLNGLSVNIMPTGLINLWATDFLQYVEDDNTPAIQIDLGIRKKGSGSGFPEDAQGNPVSMLTFNCVELGSQEVELWARDIDGNTAFCETYVIVQDNFNQCAGSGIDDLALCIRRWCDGSLVPAELSISGNSPFLPPLTQIPVSGDLDGNGCWRINVGIPLGINYTITPVNDNNPLNGVTPLDLVKISRHILGLEPLSSYAMIAADANKSNSITTFDIVESRKLIAGVYQELPNNTSWRFVDAEYVFPNEQNPFQSAFPEEIFLGDPVDSTYYAGFYAIKVGDVDCDATPGGLTQTDDRAQALLQLPDAELKTGESIAIPFTLGKSGEWLALSTGLTFDPGLLVIENIEPGLLPEMDRSLFFSPEPGQLNMVWFQPTPYFIQQQTPLFTLHLRALAPLRLSETLRLTQPDTEHPRRMRSEGYDKHETPYTLTAAFSGSATPSENSRVLPAQPNPTRQGANLPLFLADASEVTVRVTDAAGRVVWQRQQSLPGGFHPVEIPAEAINQPGVYTWQLRAGALVESGVLVRM